MLDPIVIDELAAAWQEYAPKLQSEINALNRARTNGEKLPPHLERRLSEKQEEFDRGADPLIAAVWTGLRHSGNPPNEGRMPSQMLDVPAEQLTRPELRALAVYWMLRDAGDDDPSAPDFDRELRRRRTESDGLLDKYAAVVKAQSIPDRHVSCAVVHATVQHLVDQGVPANDENIRAAAAAVQRRFDHRKHRALPLTDMTDNAIVELIADHLRAAAVVYAHDRLDEANVFAAVDNIIHDADLGKTAIGRNAVERIEDYRRDQQYRFIADERLDALRDRLLGPPFPTLWRDLVTACHQFVARLTSVDLVKSKIPESISTEAVRVAALTLATHLSEGGWGSTYAAAESLRSQIIDARGILGAGTIERAYSSRDWLGVVVHAAGGSVSDITREFAIAQAGTTVISWLAVKAEDLASGLPVLDIDVVAAGSSDDPFESPTDGDFATACEQLYELLDFDEADELATGEAEEPDDEDVSAPHPSYRRGAVTLTPAMFPTGGVETGS